jgi:hypothetical protein
MGADNAPADFLLVPEISEIELAKLHKVAHCAAAVEQAIRRDETGDIIGEQYTGNGNGGNISRQTLLLNGNLYRALNDLNKVPDKGKEG